MRYSDRSLSRSPRTFSSCLLVLLFILYVHQGIGQQASVAAAGRSTPPPAVNATNGSSDTQPDNRYRIGPGDVLEVRVSRAPELSRDGVRVDQRGMIRMPMWDDDVPAACLTEGELAASIAKIYLKYKKAPHVDVFVKEFQSQPVAVIGAVHAPSQFKLQRPVRLSELLSFAGGPSLCDKSVPPEGDTSGFVSYKLSDTLHAVPEANPFVRPGDLIHVPDADQVYVLGNVLRPLAISLNEPLTVSRAIAIAGGTAPSTKKDRVRIIRQLPGSTQKQEIKVDLTAIEKNKALDIALMANDVVDVPISGTKSLLRSLVGTIAPTVGQMPIRVIP